MSTSVWARKTLPLRLNPFRSQPVMGEAWGALLVPRGRQWGTIWEPLESSNPEIVVVIQSLSKIEPNHAAKLPENRTHEGTLFSLFSYNCHVVICLYPFTNHLLSSPCFIHIYIGSTSKANSFRDIFTDRKSVV